MSAISTYLQRILNAIWAKDVRQAIHDAISQCYDDVNKPALQTDAMQRAVQAKIDAGEMAALTIADGSLTGAKLANGTIPTAKIADGAVTAAKLSDDITFETDKTLSVSDMPADAEATGNAIDEVKADLDALEPLSNDIKIALFNLASHIGGWTDGNGQEYVDALGVALGITHEWDDGYTWLYQPTDGLLSEEDYATSNLVGQGGTETLTQNALRLHADKPEKESAGQNAIRYNFTPGTIRRLMGKISLVDVATSQVGSAVIGGGFQIMVTNGTNGLLNYIGVSGQYIAVEYYVGTSKQAVVTQIPVSGDHIFEAILTESGQTLKIDGNTVLDGVGLSTFYTTFNRVGVAATSPLFVTTNGVTTDIMWLAAYTE